MSSIRLRFALIVASTAGIISRTILRRPGETLPGRLLLLIAPDALKQLSKNRRIILISGTNGKTSTTREIATLLRPLGRIATSPSGSNLTRGSATAMMKRSALAVLEVDELHLPEVVAATNPEYVLLLNLTRDQLHRMHEVKRVADRWRSMVESAPTTEFIGDIDDPFINYVLQGARKLTTISFGGRAHQDGAVCPQCGRYMEWSAGNYLSDCGLTNSGADITLPAGNASYRNSELARVVAKKFGIDDVPSTDLHLMERRVSKKFGAVNASFRLTKNPASWSEALAGLQSSRITLILNAREVDGIDTSWIWDISFAALAGKEVVVTGERGIDLAYRLHVEGVKALLVTTFDEAIAYFAEGEIEVLAAYTAFHGLVM